MTQQLSSFKTEFNTQPQRNVQGEFNPFASPQKNKPDATDSSLGDPVRALDRSQELIQQDQNGLPDNAVNRAPNRRQTDLSVVTSCQVCMTATFTLHYYYYYSPHLVFFLSQKFKYSLEMSVHIIINLLPAVVTVLNILWSTKNNFHPAPQNVT